MQLRALQPLGGHSQGSWAPSPIVAKLQDPVASVTFVTLIVPPLVINKFQCFYKGNWINSSIFILYLVYKPEALDVQLDKLLYI